MTSEGPTDNDTNSFLDQSINPCCYYWNPSPSQTLTGLRNLNMANVLLQITIFQDHKEAKHIARECQHKAKWFALELYQFITQDFQKWKHPDLCSRHCSGHDIHPQSWLMSNCILCSLNWSSNKPGCSALPNNLAIIHAEYNGGSSTQSVSQYQEISFLTKIGQSWTGMDYDQ
jgi:hypothetical protein